MPGRARRTIATLLAALFVLGVAVPQANAQGAGVLVVGDSLEELTSPYLSRYLPGVKLTVNAVGGSNSYQIFDLFQESYDPSQSVVVFDAGTNDDPEYPQILAGNLAKVAAIVGPGTCMVVPTIHGYTVNGVDNAGKNRVVREFAASRPGTQVPDWAELIHGQPDLLMADGLHPTVPQGAEARAQLIAQGVLGCLGAAATSSAAPPQRQSRPVEPRLAPVSAMERRQRSLVGVIGAELGRQLVVAVAGDPLLAAAVSVIPVR
jgi:hypothetical protein